MESADHGRQHRGVAARAAAVARSTSAGHRSSAELVQIACFLKLQEGFIARLPEEVLLDLCQRTELQEVGAGGALFDEGDPIRKAFIVVSGSISLQEDGAKAVGTADLLTADKHLEQCKDAEAVSQWLTNAQPSARGTSFRGPGYSLHHQTLQSSTNRSEHGESRAPSLQLPHVEARSPTPVLQPMLDRTHSAHGHAAMQPILDRTHSTHSHAATHDVEADRQPHLGKSLLPPQDFQLQHRIHTSLVDTVKAMAHEAAKGGGNQDEAQRDGRGVVPSGFMSDFERLTRVLDKPSDDFKQSTTKELVIDTSLPLASFRRGASPLTILPTPAQVGDKSSATTPATVGKSSLFRKSAEWVSPGACSAVESNPLASLAATASLLARRRGPRRGKQEPVEYGGGEIIGLAVGLQGTRKEHVFGATAVKNSVLLAFDIETLQAAVTAECSRLHDAREAMVLQAFPAARVLEKERRERLVQCFKCSRHRLGTVILQEGERRSAHSEQNRLLVLVDGAARAVKDASGKGPRRGRSRQVGFRQDIGDILPGCIINAASQLLGAAEPLSIVAGSAEVTIASASLLELVRIAGGNVLEEVRSLHEDLSKFRAQRLASVDSVAMSQSNRNDNSNNNTSSNSRNIRQSSADSGDGDALLPPHEVIGEGHGDGASSSQQSQPELSFLDWLTVVQCAREGNRALDAKSFTAGRHEAMRSAETVEKLKAAVLAYSHNREGNVSLLPLPKSPPMGDRTRNLTFPGARRTTREERMMLWTAEALPEIFLALGNRLHGLNPREGGEQEAKMSSQRSKSNQPVGTPDSDIFRIPVSPYDLEKLMLSDLRFGHEIAREWSNTPHLALLGSELDGGEERGRSAALTAGPPLPRPLTSGTRFRRSLRGFANAGLSRGASTAPAAASSLDRTLDIRPLTPDAFPTQTVIVQRATPSPPLSELTSSTPPPQTPAEVTLRRDAVEAPNISVAAATSLPTGQQLANLRHAFDLVEALQGPQAQDGFGDGGVAAPTSLGQMSTIFDETGGWAPLVSFMSSVPFASANSRVARTPASMEPEEPISSSSSIFQAYEVPLGASCHDFSPHEHSHQHQYIGDEFQAELLQRGKSAARPTSRQPEEPTTPRLPSSRDGARPSGSASGGASARKLQHLQASFVKPWRPARGSSRRRSCCEQLQTRQEMRLNASRVLMVNGIDHFLEKPGERR